MFWMKTRCERGVHNFEARYDKSSAKNPKIRTYADVSTILDKFRDVIYVHDICTRCGKIVKRDN